MPWRRVRRHSNLQRSREGERFAGVDHDAGMTQEECTEEEGGGERGARAGDSEGKGEVPRARRWAVEHDGFERRRFA